MHWNRIKVNYWKSFYKGDYIGDYNRAYNISNYKFINGIVTCLINDRYLPRKLTQNTYFLNDRTNFCWHAETIIMDRDTIDSPIGWGTRLLRA